MNAEAYQDHLTFDYLGYEDHQFDARHALLLCGLALQTGGQFQAKICL
jgi:hypothetical protein